MTKYPARQMPRLLPSAERKRLTQCDADVLYRVVLIDIEIPRGVHFEIEGAMAGDKVQHVIQEANTGSDFPLAPAFYG